MNLLWLVVAVAASAALGLFVPMAFRNGWLTCGYAARAARRLYASWGQLGMQPKVKQLIALCV